MQLADLSLIPIIIGALILGFALGGALQSRKDLAMANSADTLKSAIADAAAASKAQADQITALTTRAESAEADLAADEQAIADGVAQLKSAAPAA